MRGDFFVFLVKLQRTYILICMWYVYFYKDPRDNSIFYVGKGKNNRSRSHLYRASTWVKQGRPSPCGSLNLHLIRKIVKIREEGFEPIVEIVEKYEEEKDAYAREIQEISLRKETLCNLTEGGEGYRVSEERRKQVAQKHREWMQSESGIAWRKKFSESRKREGNPNFGKKEDEEHKKSRMKNFLEKERWNKGLKGDPRSKGPKPGSLPHNAKTCSAINVESGHVIVGESKIRLFKKMKELGIQISLSTISRALEEDVPKMGWRFTYERLQEQS